MQKCNVINWFNLVMILTSSGGLGTIKAIMVHTSLGMVYYTIDPNFGIMNRHLGKSNYGFA